MEYTLIDYQRDASERVLKALQRGSRDWNEYQSLSAFGLSAVTGAGKTVIATQVIEAILHGSSDMNIEPDPKAVFLWITDDPALNRQTRTRMLAASDTLSWGQLRPIETDFMDGTLAAGNVYFLNVQKLFSGNNLTKSDVDERDHSMWEVLTHTIQVAKLNLFVVLDEAHRGMRLPKDRATTVRRIIDGQPGSNPPVPVVWGISATIDRFALAMAGTKDRTTYPAIEVDIEKVRSSGLVKDKIELKHPDEKGDFHATLLTRAVNDTLDFEKRWAEYSADQSEPPVVPLLVVQVPDLVSVAAIGQSVNIIESAWPDLPMDAISHVFSNRADIEVDSKGGAKRSIRWISPEFIQGDNDIRVVLAKEAVSTGWDCPRAEVLYSQRTANDATHIAQIIGRMVRAPLAHAIATDDTLNSVACYLPLFDTGNLEAVVSRLTGGGEDAVSPAIVAESALFERNTSLDPSVFEVLEAVPTLPAPDALARPLSRAKLLVTLLTDDVSGEAFLPSAGAALRASLNSKLDGLAAQHADLVEANANDLFTARIASNIAAFGETTSTQSDVQSVSTHARDVDRAYQKTVKQAKEGVGEDYYKYRIRQSGAESDPLDVKVEVAALFTVPKVIKELDTQATLWVQQQLANFAVEIDNTVGERRVAFQRIKEQSSEPEIGRIALTANSRAQTKTNKGAVLELFAGHVFADENGMYPTKLNDWETAVIRTEIGRPSFVAWFRNPATLNYSAHRIAYRDDSNKWRNLRVDFVIISKRGDGTLAASLIDPHGDHLADARAKLIALADFAERFDGQFVRIESISKVEDGSLRALNLTDAKVRTAVRAFKGAKVSPLYISEASREYK